jgi:hypothetical protein
LTILTNDYRTIRGRTVTALLGDETSLWQPGETASDDEELVAAVTPSMLTIADGGLVLLSSTSLIVNSIAAGLDADPSLPPEPLLDERHRWSRCRPHEHNCS